MKHANSLSWCSSVRLAVPFLVSTRSRFRSLRVGSTFGNPILFDGTGSRVKVQSTCRYLGSQPFPPISVMLLGTNHGVAPTENLGIKGPITILRSGGRLGRLTTYNSA